MDNAVSIVKRDPTAGRLYARDAAAARLQLRRLQLELESHGVRLPIAAILPLAVRAVDGAALLKLATGAKR